MMIKTMRYGSSQGFYTVVVNDDGRGIGLSSVDTRWGSCLRCCNEKQIADMMAQPSAKAFFEKEAKERDCCGVYPVFFFNGSEIRERSM